MNYPSPELPSVVSSLPGQGMVTSPSIMSASGMKTPSWSAPVDAQRPPIISTTAGKATRHPHSHGEADRWMRFCALSQEQGISMNGWRGLIFTAQYAQHTNLKPPTQKLASTHLFPPPSLPQMYIAVSVAQDFSASSCEGDFASVYNRISLAT